MTHRLRQDDERRLYGADYADHGLVFAQPDGNPLRPDWISAAFKRHLVAAGVIAEGEPVSPMKALRSSMVAALHEAGTQLEVISAVTGHSGTKVTREHYLSVSAERTREPFGLIAAQLSAGRTDRLSDQRPETVGSPESREGG
jgi:site-specific recombinase XerD